MPDPATAPPPQPAAPLRRLLVVLHEELVQSAQRYTALARLVEQALARLDAAAASPPATTTPQMDRSSK
jgi:hypothetical protein